MNRQRWEELRDRHNRWVAAASEQHKIERDEGRVYCSVCGHPASSWQHLSAPEVSP